MRGIRRLSGTVPGVVAARLVPACLALAVGAAILAVAVPRLGAAVWLTLRDPVVAAIQSGAPVSTAELRGLVASRELALEWVDHGRAHAEMAAALTSLAAREAPGSAAARELLERAVAALAAALARAPADPRGWLRLAVLENALDGPTVRAARALQLSVQTGRHDTPEFLALRLGLALRHWPLFEPAERRRMEEQIRALWREAPGTLVRLVVDGWHYAAIVRAALAELPGEPERLDALVAETMRDRSLTPAP